MRVNVEVEKPWISNEAITIIGCIALAALAIRNVDSKILKNKLI